MKASTAWSPAAGLNVVSVERGDQTWTVTVDGRLPPACPRCGALSNSRHSTYSRTLRDLSAQKAPVIVRARLGRWRCRNLKCDQRIFAERLPGLVAPLSRRTTRLAEIVRLLGHSAGGRPSERLMRRLGMPVSDTTILTILKKYAGARSENGAAAAVRVAGVDDWAWLMQWSKRGAHLLLQVRAAVFNGDLRERLTYKPPKQANRSRIAWMFEPTPPLLKAA